MAGDEPGDGGEPRWGVADAVAGTVLVIVVPALVAAVVLGLAGVTDTSSLALWAVVLLQVPLWAGLLAVPAWASRTKGRRSLRLDFGLALRWSDVPLGLAVGVAAQFGLGLLTNVLYQALRIDTNGLDDAARQLTDRAHNPGAVACLLLLTVVGAPLFEELFYRGLWLRSAARRWGPGVGILVSSLVFGAVHFEPIAFVPLAGFGAIAAWLAVRTGRLGPGIVAHFAFNLSSVLVLLVT